MNIRSHFLVHWTGKDISTKKPSELSPKETQQFDERLRDIVRDGFWMTVGEEMIHGQKNTSIRASIARVCFTELKLSQTENHAKRYGLLGIGLSRLFVLSRCGNPVLYVQNGKNGTVIQSLDYIHKIASKNREELKTLEIVLGFLKKMSDKDKEKLGYYDEMEWRIVHTDELEKKGYIKFRNSTFYLSLRPDLIKIIIFPNRKTKEMALEDPWLKKNLFNKKIPIITTISDCRNF